MLNFLLQSCNLPAPPTADIAAALNRRKRSIERGKRQAAAEHALRRQQRQHAVFTAAVLQKAPSSQPSSSPPPSSSETASAFDADEDPVEAAERRDWLPEVGASWDEASRGRLHAPKPRLGTAASLGDLSTSRRAAHGAAARRGQRTEARGAAPLPQSVF